MHSGEWKSRTKMADRVLQIGVFLCLVDVVGYFLDKDVGVFVGAGSLMIMALKVTMVAGKVADDKNRTR